MNSFAGDFEEHALGLILRTDRYFLFFGNSKANVDLIQSTFPDFHFQNIKQTHSDTIVESSDVLVEADAHYTSLIKTALFIKSADCLPVLIFCHQTGRVASVHAGWKGVVNQIVLKTLARLQSTGSSENRFEIWIGPHILQKSFEVDLSVLKQLDLATYKLKRSDYSYEENKKFYVDLNQIVVSQIHNVADNNVPIHFLNRDTKTDLNFCSFRREKEKAGRNFSFIAALA